MSSALFQPLSMRSVTLPNRVVVAPMCQYSAENGSATDWHIMHLGSLAMGGPGLLFTEATGVEPRGRISPWCLGLYTDENEAALARVIGFIRQHSKTLLAMQLAHAGRKSSILPPWMGGNALPEDHPEAWVRRGPSAVGFGAFPPPLPMTRADMDEVRDAFLQATRRCIRLGFDVLELHAAHGYLMHSFLSPLSNQRNDEFGGDRAGRMRFPLELLEAVRALWPAEKPLGVRISATDWMPGGWDLEDSVAFCRELAQRGCDFIDVSSGGAHPDQQITVGPGYQVPFAERIRQEAGLPVMAVGNITEAAQAEAIVKEGRADMVALARHHLYDPHFTWHAAEALGGEPHYPPQYARCHPSLRGANFFVKGQGKKSAA